MARADLLELLQDLLGEIAVPPAVWAEVTEGLDRPGAMAVRTAGWIKAADLDGTGKVTASVLQQIQHDPGESEAIALAVQVGADLLLMDEALGRRTAQAMGLSVAGTLGLILRAWRQGLLSDPQQTLRRLQHEGLWVSTALTEWFADQVRPSGETGADEDRHERAR